MRKEKTHEENEEEYEELEKPRIELTKITAEESLGSFATLPHELIWYLWSFFTDEALAKLSITSKKFNQLIYSYLDCRSYDSYGRFSLLPNETKDQIFGLLTKKDLSNLLLMSLPWANEIKPILHSRTPIRHRSFEETDKLSGLDLRNTVFIACSMNKTNCHQTNFANAKFLRSESDKISLGLFSTTIKKETNEITKVIMTKTNFTSANLNYTELRESNFSEARMSKATFRATNIQDCNFTKADMRECDFSPIPISELKDSGYQSQIELSDHLISDLSGTQHQTTGISAKIDGTQLIECNLKSANLTDIFMHMVDLSNANLFGANLYNGYLLACTLTNADFRNANLIKIRLLCDVENAQFDGAEFIDQQTAFATPEALHEELSYISRNCYRNKALLKKPIVDDFIKKMLNSTAITKENLEAFKSIAIEHPMFGHRNKLTSWINFVKKSNSILRIETAFATKMQELEHSSTPTNN